VVAPPVPGADPELELTGDEQATRELIPRPHKTQVARFTELSCTSIVLISASVVVVGRYVV
jgi:hypothetical protein